MPSAISWAEPGLATQTRPKPVVIADGRAPTLGSSGSASRVRWSIVATVALGWCSTQARPPASATPLGRSPTGTVVSDALAPRTGC